MDAANVLAVKPLLSAHQGQIHLLGRNGPLAAAAITHNANRDDAEGLAGGRRPLTGGREAPILQVGSVVGGDTGPVSLAPAILPKETSL